MQKVRIAGIGEYVDREVTLEGWLYNKRGSKKIHFLQIRDGSGVIQAVGARADLGDELFAAADELSQEASLRVTGTVRADDRAPSGYELIMSGFERVGASVDYPITPKE
ncbi:MAG: asparagine--tRNA ligase, partial [bacterium]|nr:asparagine--tRNA ligase [bacterium]